MKIRHEINLLRKYETYYSTRVKSAAFKWDASKYSGTVSVYLEVVGNSSSNTLQLKNQSGTTVATLTMPTSTSRSRGANISASLTNGLWYYLALSSTTGTVLIQARIIVIQDTSTSALTATRVYIPLGRVNETLQTSGYYYDYYMYAAGYDSAEWSAGTISASIQCMSYTTDAMYSIYLAIQKTPNYGSRSGESNEASTTISGTYPNFVEFTGVTLSDDYFYYPAFYTSDNKATAHFDGGFLVIDLSDATEISKFVEYAFVFGLSASSSSDQHFPLYYHDDEEWTGINVTQRTEWDTNESTDEGREFTLWDKTGSSSLASSTVSFYTGSSPYDYRGGALVSLGDNNEYGLDVA